MLDPTFDQKRPAAPNRRGKDVEKRLAALDAAGLDAHAPRKVHPIRRGIPVRLIIRVALRPTWLTPRFRSTGLAGLAGDEFEAENTTPLRSEDEALIRDFLRRFGGGSSDPADDPNDKNIGDQSSKDEE